MYNEIEKISFQGRIISIQPRTRVWRYLMDNRTHYHLGYNLFLEDEDSEQKKQFVVAISETQQQKGMFRIGDVISGTAWTKKYPEREFADYNRAGSLKLLQSTNDKQDDNAPPWGILPPPMSVYEYRGARLLSKSRWKTKCFECAWANMANVEIQWDFEKNIKKYRFESFCYGPFSCKNYTMGKPRAVSCKNRCTVYDDGCLDGLCTAHRDYDE